MTDGLFPEPDGARLDPPPDLSPGRRRTQRQHALLDAGIHPLTGGRARPDLGTCGTCAFRHLHRHGGYPKCESPDTPRPTHGPATDVRASWPACQHYEPKEKP